MIQWKKVKDYQAIWYANGKREWDMLPIIADQAVIGLSDGTISYALGYRTSRNLFGKTFSYADVVNMESWEAFSFQVENIFYLGVINGDPKMIARTKDGLKLYENFAQSVKNIEPDADKATLTPLGYYNMFVSYDKDAYYPEIFRTSPSSGTIKSFYDYFGFQAFEDSMGKHFILFIEDAQSTEENPVWYFVDNFRIVSEAIRFTKFIPDDSEEYVEDWWVDAAGVINLKATTTWYYHLDSAWILVKWATKSKENTFTFVKYFEDTDIPEIVGKNPQGYFLIDRDKTTLNQKETKNIVYYKDFLAYTHIPQKPLFFFQSSESVVLVVGPEGQIHYQTNLVWQKGNFEGILILEDGTLQVTLKSNEVRRYTKFK